MVLGFDEPRPTKEQYIQVANRLEEGFSTCKVPGMSLMIYGSFIRGDYTPGRSDIDGVILFPSGVPIDKRDMQNIGGIVAHALDGTTVPFQITVTDLVTMRDGRFNTYDPSFKPYFAKECVVVGVDYRDMFRYEHCSLQDQQALRFNLRKARTGLLFSQRDMRNGDHARLVERFTKATDAVSRSSKQIAALIDGGLFFNRFSAIDYWHCEFPDIDIDVLRELKELYSHPSQLDALYRDEKRMIRVWGDSVTCFEQMLHRYLELNPRDDDGVVGR